MRTKQLGLGDFFQELLGKFHFAIKDQELLDSLNETKLSGTEGLELIYHIDKSIALPQIPQVSAQEILKEVNEKEEQFEKFWELYNKKVGTKDAKMKFLKLSKSDIEKIFVTLPHYLKSTPDIKFRKHPVTYLNQRTWEDEGYVQSPQQAINRPNSAFKF
jgi:hypothetical protein